MKLLIRPAEINDAQSILDIYSPYIRQTVITFETEVPTLSEFSKRVETILQNYPYLVCETGGKSSDTHTLPGTANVPPTGTAQTFPFMWTWLTGIRVLANGCTQSYSRRWNPTHITPRTQASPCPTKAVLGCTKRLGFRKSAFTTTLATRPESGWMSDGSKSH